MPETGAFHVYAARYLGPATGYTVAPALLVDWTVALGSSFTAAGFCMQYWFPQVPVWTWCVVFCVVIFALNVISTRFFAEGEFWFSLVKVITIIAFIILGGAAIFGFIPMQDGSPAPSLSNITAEGWFPHGGLPILMTMVAVNFAFSGTELIGIAAGGNGKPTQGYSGCYSHHHRPAHHLLYWHRVCAGGADPHAAGWRGEKSVCAGV